MAGPATMAERKGARRPDLVPAEVRELLAGGGVSVNHMEQIAFDMGALLCHAFPNLSEQADRLRCGGLVGKMRTGGEVLHESYGHAAWSLASSHASDTVRGWGVMALAACETLSLDALIESVKPFADDPHFAVREWAWLAVRPRVIAEPGRSIELLLKSTRSPSPRIRRFASEATRPRGVWSAHIPPLKEQPELAEGILLPLRDDGSRYVQDSVGNWLNDASKSRPDWVERICTIWLDESRSDATRRICRRGMRTLAKAHKAQHPVRGR